MVLPQGGEYICFRGEYSPPLQGGWINPWLHLISRTAGNILWSCITAACTVVRPVLQNCTMLHLTTTPPGLIIKYCVSPARTDNKFYVRPLCLDDSPFGLFAPWLIRPVRWTIRPLACWPLHVGRFSPIVYYNNYMEMTSGSPAVAGQSELGVQGVWTGHVSRRQK